MAYKIEEIEGIGPGYAQKLTLVNIRTTADLLKSCSDPRGRETVSARTGISPAQLLKWVNLADLMRISGIGSEYSELLEAAGVDTVKELRTRNADNLAAALKDANTRKRLTRTTPGTGTVAKWVKEAADMTPMVTH